MPEFEFEHTPTPWEVQRNDAAAGWIRYEIVEPSTGVRAAETDDNLNHRARLDAAFIVRAVNAHEGLVKAVEYAMEVFEEACSCRVCGPCEYKPKMSAALAQAKGEDR